MTPLANPTAISGRASLLFQGYTTKISNGFNFHVKPWELKWNHIQPLTSPRTHHKPTLGTDTHLFHDETRLIMTAMVNHV